MSSSHPGIGQRALLVVAPIALLAPAAAARLYDREPPRLEVGVELAFPLFDADPSFRELAPGMLFGLAAGVHVASDLRLGVVVRAAITDPDGERYEVLSDVTWSWVGEPRLPDPPAVRAALSFEAGWRTTELHGSDFVVVDQGLELSLGLELGLVVFEDVSLSMQLATVAGTASNDAVDAWAPKLRFGFCFATLL